MMALLVHEPIMFGQFALAQMFNLQNRPDETLHMCTCVYTLS